MKSLILERFETSAATALHTAPDAEAEEEARRAAAALDAETAIAEAAATATRQTALAEAINDLSGAIARSRAGAIQVICDDLGKLIAEALPSLLSTGFRQEIAAASFEILHATNLAGATLKVSPEDAEIIIAALSAHRPAEPIVVKPDPTMAAGQARLSWQQGGATFNIDAWTDQMRAHLAAQFQARAEQGTSE